MGKYLLPAVVFCLVFASISEANDSEFPKRFGLASLLNGKFVSVLPDRQNRLAAISDRIGNSETFEAVDLPRVGTNKGFRSPIGIRSVLNGKYLCSENDFLTASKNDLGDDEKFLVYYEKNDDEKIGLELKRFEKFVRNDASDPFGELTLDEYPNELIAFELVPLDSGSVDKEVTQPKPDGDHGERPDGGEHNTDDEHNKPDYVPTPPDNGIVSVITTTTTVSPGPDNTEEEFKKHAKFPKRFALQSAANGGNIKVYKNDSLALLSNGDLKDDWETFEAIELAESMKKDNETLIALRSFANGKFLSAKEAQDKKLQKFPLLANRDVIEDTEKFYVYYGDNGGIGLKSKSRGKFVGANSNKFKPIQVDRNNFYDWEKFDVIPVPDRSRFPKVFALKAKANNHFVRVNKNEAVPLAPNGKNTDNFDAFEATLLPESQRPLGENEALISLKSVANGKYLSARDFKKQNVLADRFVLGDSEKFHVFYGPNNMIGLKSKLTRKFVNANPNKDKALSVDRDNFGEWEMFEVVEILERSQFPQNFALKSRANGKFVRVDKKLTSPMMADSNTNFEMERFEAVTIPDAMKLGENGTLIALKSVSNGKFASLRNDNLFSDKDAAIQDTEKFHVYYGPSNTIALKSKANGRFVGAHSNKKKPLHVNVEKMQDWELFEIVPY